MQIIGKFRRSSLGDRFLWNYRCVRRVRKVQSTRCDETRLYNAWPSSRFVSRGACGPGFKGRTAHRGTQGVIIARTV